MNFNCHIYDVVSKIPHGKVVSYGFVATLLGKPRSARQVGWALANLPNEKKVPWWRVVNSDGFISIKNRRFTKDMQKELLENEGVIFSEDLKLDIKKYHWTPKRF